MWPWRKAVSACDETGREASAGLSPVQCVLVPLTDVRTRASSSLSMIRAVAASHVVKKDYAGNVSGGVCNRDEGFMVELAESLMRL